MAMAMISKQARNAGPASSGSVIGGLHLQYLDELQRLVPGQYYRLNIPSDVARYPYRVVSEALVEGHGQGIV